MENQTTERQKDLIIIGAQGSGKTTLAEKRAAKYQRHRVFVTEFNWNTDHTWASIRGGLVGRGGADLIIIEGVQAGFQVDDLVSMIDNFFKNIPSLRPSLIFTSIYLKELGHSARSGNYEVVNL